MAELSQGGRSVVATASSAVTRPSASWIQTVSASVGPGIAARTVARGSSTARGGAGVAAGGAAPRGPTAGGPLPGRPGPAGCPAGRAGLHGQPDRPPGQDPHEPAVLD